MRRLTIFAALLLAALLVSLPALAQQDVITTLIGGGPNGIPALDANLYNPYGTAVDSSGTVYIAAYNQNRVFKVDSTGTITVVAGNGAPGYSGDGVVGGAALYATLNHPFAVAVDASKNVYIADYNNCVIRMVNTAGTISTIAGTQGSCSYAGDGGKATAAEIYYPEGVGVDTLGNLYIGDYANCDVRKVILSTNIISTAAGNHTCGYSGDGGAATAAQLNYVSAVETDTAGDLFIADYGNCVIREVTKSTGKISTIAGDHTLGCGFSGDGNPATGAQIYQVFGLAVNGGGTVVAIADYQNQRIRQFTVGGDINTIAGNGTACAGVCGEGGAATSAELYYPVGVAENSSGSTIYVGNNSNYVVDDITGGNLNRFAGNHSYNTETLITGAPAGGVSLNNPYGLAIDPSGDVYIADSHDYMVREYVKSTGLVNFFAGNGTYGFSGDGGAATSADFTYIWGVARDASGNIYIADGSNCLIREVTAGNVNVFAGLVVSNSPRCGYTGDGGPATSAELYQPYGVAVDKKGSIYIADYSEHVIRKVTAGVINTIAGIGGLAGYSGDGGPATNALLNGPVAVAVDPAGNVFIADYNNSRVREISAATGIITTVAGTGNSTFSGDGLATSNSVYAPQGVAVDANDNLFISDYNERVRWVSPNGIMTTIAGNGTPGYAGDGGLATSGNLYEPTGIVLDAAGDVLVSDYNNLRVRSISAFSALSTSSGSLAFGLTSVGATSSPETLTLSAYGPVTISNIATSPNFSEADDCPTSLTNGTTCTMYVYFVPTGSGSVTGNITVNSNGFFNQTNTVNLAGLGSAISLTGAPVSFGNQLVKTTSANKVVSVSNKGKTAITMGAVTLTDTTDYTIVSNTCPASGSTLAAAGSCAITVSFTPASTGAKRGTVVVNDSDPSSPQLIGLTGTGSSNVALSPTAVTFPTTAVGVPSLASKIVLTNSTGVQITMGNPALSVTGTFVIAGTTTCTPDLIIAAGGTCDIYVTFKPTKVGFAMGSVSVFDSDVTSPQGVALQGYGTGIKFTPSTLNFGTVTDANQVNSTATITNVGTTPVFFTGAELSGTNSADFAVNYADNPPCNNNAANPLLPGKTCQITVYFDPSKVGAEKAVYKVFDNSVGSPQSLSLVGTGQN
jgi:hypothetical protein